MSRKSILIIFPGGLGDLILFSPALLALRDEYKDAEITLILEPRAYAGGQELLGHEFSIIKFNLKNIKTPQRVLKLIQLMQGHDTIISSGRSPWIALLLRLSNAKRRIGYQSKTDFLLTDRIEYQPRKYFAEIYADLVGPLLENNHNEFTPSLELFKDDLSFPEHKDYILIHPGNSAVAREKHILKSPPPQVWAKLINNLSQEYPNHQLILINGPDDLAITGQIINQCSQIENFIYFDEDLTISALAAWIKNADLFYCIDSAPMHIGVAVGANMRILFGPTDYRVLLPDNYQDSVVKVNNLLCSPCLWDRRAQSCQQPICVNLL